MKIALDYDDTYTRDPELWDAFIQRADLHGHEVRIVTMRGPSMESFMPNWKLLDTDDVIYTDGKAKREFCRQIGFEPDIWIDDRPELIHMDWEEYRRKV